MKINIETYVSFNLYMVKYMYILNIRFKISLIYFLLIIEKKKYKYFGFIFFVDITY